MENVQVKIGGSKYQIGSGYYFYTDALDLKKSRKEVLKKLEEGWVDKQTKYIAITINFYDPIFKIMMNYSVFYDFRFGFSDLVRKYFWLIILVCYKIDFLPYYL